MQPHGIPGGLFNDNIATGKAGIDSDSIHNGNDTGDDRWIVPGVGD
jgi:hypothetical protein